MESITLNIEQYLKIKYEDERIIFGRAIPRK